MEKIKEFQKTPKAIASIKRISDYYIKPGISFLPAVEAYSALNPIIVTNAETLDDLLAQRG